MNDTHITDEEAAKRVQEGEGEAFGILMTRYADKLSRYGKRFLSKSEDIEDIVQDVFVSAYQNIQSFDTSRQFSSWIYRIAHNAYVNKLKKSTREKLVPLDFDIFISHPVYEDPHEKEREQQEMRKMIDRFLAELSPKMREVLILYYLEDMAYKDIADILEIPVSTVGVRLKRAKEALAEIYKKYEPGA